MTYSSLLYATEGRIARITLNRPERLNAIDDTMPGDIPCAVAGGRGLALGADLVVMAEDARIGYMPARVWSCPTTAMWVYRLGAERAKRMLLTGDTIDGRTAADWGLVVESV